MILSLDAYRQLGRNAAEALNRRSTEWLEFHCKSYRASLVLENEFDQRIAEKAYMEAFKANRRKPKEKDDGEV